MIVFTVHEPPNPPTDRIDRAEKLEFVRDGFTPLAAAIPPLWLALNKLWVALLIYALVATAISLVLKSVGVDPSLITLINLAANIVIGFEADSIKRWTLGRRGWDEVGTVTGKNRAECERRFFEGWLVQQPLLRASTGDRASRSPNVGLADASNASWAAANGQPGQTPDVNTVSPRPLWRRLMQR